MLELTNANAVELSVLIGVGGCSCPNCFKIYRNGSVSWALMNKPPVSASAADATTCFNVLHTMCKGPLRSGWMISSPCLVFSDR